MAHYPIGKNISLLYRAQQSFFKLQTKSFEIGGAQLSFIFSLYLYPGSSQDDMAKILEQDKTTITRAALKLEKHGVIARTKDPIDQRVIRLQLTEKGLAVHDELKNVAKDWHDVLMNGMSEKDQSEFRRLNDIVAENARQFKQAHAEEKDNQVKHESE